MSSKQSYSIPELKEKIAKLESFDSSRGQNIIPTTKQLVNLCNSLALSLINYKDFKNATYFLNKSLKARYFSTESRALAHGIQAFIFLKQQNLQDCLSHVYKFHVYQIKDQSLKIPLSLLTIIALWKIKEFPEACSHQDLAQKALSSLDSQQSRYSEKNIKNIKGILALFAAALIIKLNKDTQKALKICKHALVEQNDEESSICSVIIDFMYKIEQPHRPDFLLTDSLVNVVFKSAFLPFVNPNTPHIKLFQSKKICFSKIKMKKNSTGSVLDKNWWEVPEFAMNNLKSKILKAKKYRKSWVLSSSFNLGKKINVFSPHIGQSPTKKIAADKSGHLAMEFQPNKTKLFRIHRRLSIMK